MRPLVVHRVQEKIWSNYQARTYTKVVNNEKNN